jgi:aryl-alcohol dehydrogenase-like predicted oxidoreductase
MQTRPLGRSGLHVSPVGLGAGPLGDARLGDAEADALVGAALDLGVTLFDTARSYGASEERLARALGARRRDVVLATKGGYGVDGVADWTPDAIRLGIDGALARMRTDAIDVFFLHSCDLGTLTRDDLLEELDRAKRDGKVRLAGYSGEGDALAWAVASGRFDVVECSVNPFDQSNIARAIRDADARGLGVLAKRPLANAAFRFDAPPEAHDVRVYWDRMRAMALDPSPLAWPALSVRFAAFAPGVTAALVGTSRAAHLESAVRAVGEGPLDDSTAARVRDAWAARGAAWPGII